MSKDLNVCVLLASFNGEVWIQKQIDSIKSQKNINSSIFISDDGSNQVTVSYLDCTFENDKKVSFLPMKKSGSAGQNFFRLLRDVRLQDEFDYIAFSDQDDIWDDDKLITAINLLHADSADGYSSNATAFWTNGNQRIIKKAQPQQKYDYMFESAGPGCTFVLTKKLALNLQEFLSDNQEKCKNVALHDWFIYAYARSHNFRWVIDNESHMLYRQHENNVVGANVGIKAKFNRWEKMRNGWHIKQAILIADILGYSNKFPIRELKNYSFIDRFILIANVRKLRRRFRDCCALAIFFMFPLNK